jgi:hypothetical protein
MFYCSARSLNRQPSWSQFPRMYAICIHLLIVDSSFFSYYSLWSLYTGWYCFLFPPPKGTILPRLHEVQIRFLFLPRRVLLIPPQKVVRVLLILLLILPQEVARVLLLVFPRRSPGYYSYSSPWSSGYFSYSSPWSSGYFSYSSPWSSGYFSYSSPWSSTPRLEVPFRQCLILRFVATVVARGCCLRSSSG